MESDMMIDNDHIYTEEPMTRFVLCAINAKYIHSNLAVHCLKAYADRFGKADAEIIIREYTINQYVEEILRDLYKTEADVFVFSSYLWNISYVRELMGELKKICPHASIWVGGPEVSYSGAAFLEENPAADLVMQGEGELLFTGLVEWKAGGQEEKSICDRQGLGIRTDEGIAGGGMAPCACLDDIPFVYENLSDFSHKILYYESSRGCPYRCSYCLSSEDTSLRFKSPDLVFHDLDRFLAAGVRQVKFVDRTFNCNKDHAMAIWTYLRDHDRGLCNFHFEIAADLLDQEAFALFETMRPGLIQLEIGVQSTNPDTIAAIRRHMDLPKLFANSDRVRDMGRIHQHLDLIAGLPFETYERFGQSFDDLYAHRPDQLQLGFLKVLKGTYMEKQAKEYGICYRDLPPYEVLKTPWLSFADLIRLKQIEDLVETYYNSGQYVYSLRACVSAFESPFAFYEEFSSYYLEHDYHKLRHSRLEKYSILRDFISFSGRKPLHFDELLLLDYYLPERAKARPSWAPDTSALKTEFKRAFREQGSLLFPEEVKAGTYDSKATANRCHIEPFSFDPAELITKGRLISANVFCLFDYSRIHPISSQARLVSWKRS